MDTIYLIILKMMLSIFTQPSVMQRIIEEKDEQCIELDSLFTRRDSVRFEIKNIGIKHSDIVFKQAIIETNCGKTGVGKTKNNLFGFRGKNGYIKYNTWKDSVKAYKKWQDKYYKGQDYYKFLDCLWKTSDGICIRYAGDKEYTNRLKRLKI